MESKEPTPNFQQAFVQQIHDSKELMQKELDVNRAEQVLLRQRILLMKSFVNDIPSIDPQYSMLLAQVEMDLLEQDELKVREILLTQRLSEM